MQLFHPKSLLPVFVLFVVSGCAMFQHADDPNYTLCKNLQGKIQFGSNTTSTDQQSAAGLDVDKRRLQATYDKLNCSQYQWLSF